jgi:hypothetical protein
MFISDEEIATEEEEDGLPPDGTIHSLRPRTAASAVVGGRANRTPRSLRSSARTQPAPELPDPAAMFYRVRHAWEQQMKRRFDDRNAERWRLQQMRSPYRYEMGRHREVTQQAFWRASTRQERRDKRERGRSALRYQEAVRESYDHERKLVKRDYIVRSVHALRILAV